VVVGADPKSGKGRGVVATCNYEARKYGIHSAMPISQAYKRCPFAVFVPPRGRRYSEISGKIFRIFYDFTPRVEPISVDEAFLDVTGCIRLLGSPRDIAQAIKQRIFGDLHLTASVGIAPNKFIAKIASDLNKPDGLVEVLPDDILTFLWPLPISKMWGVGKKSETRLQAMGIHTIGDLAKLSQDAAVKKLGKAGLHFWSLAHGVDDRDVEAHAGAKSVSLENTFDEDVADEAVLRETITSLSDNVSRILRKKNYKGKTITLKIRLDDFSTFTRAHSYHECIDSSKIISQTCLDLFEAFDRMGKKVRLLGVAVSNLNAHPGEQLGFFQAEDQSEQKIDRVIDLIQGKFGPDLIKKASLLDKHSRRLSQSEDDEI